MISKNAYHLFAQILEYPKPGLSERIKECLSLLTSPNNEAKILLTKFQNFVDRTPLGCLEEIYTFTFDLQPVCCLYVGYHLFGEDQRRAILMARLKEHYSVHGFSLFNELPDHVGVILRFLAIENDEEREELIALCIIPALKKMVKRFEGTTNPYGELLHALFLVLHEEAQQMMNPFTPNV